MATANWSGNDLAAIARADELWIAVRRCDGSWRDAVPIWVVVAADDVYVRTWYRRDTGWFGRALRSAKTRISVPGVEAYVDIEDVSTVSAARAAVDQAYRDKYTRYGASAVDRMVGDEASATTLRLTPQRWLPRTS